MLCFLTESITYLSETVRGGRSNYFDGLGFIDYFYESNRYFLPVTLDPITCQFHCDIVPVMAVMIVDFIKRFCF